MNHNIIRFRSSTIVGIVGVKIIDAMCYNIRLRIIVLCKLCKTYPARGYKDIKIILNLQSKTEGFKDKVTIYQEYLTDGL
ncbi:hypothetical protein H8356DRAFT_1335706 [Neocallimastix lanati (nom. inval.)]|nr:hypothetical protein H8356DRAFT_1335706 [Neocallimastix sp. JGI-2020a]